MACIAMAHAHSVTMLAHEPNRMSAYILYTHQHAHTQVRAHLYTHAHTRVNTSVYTLFGVCSVDLQPCILMAYVVMASIAMDLYIYSLHSYGPMPYIVMALYPI